MLRASSKPRFHALFVWLLCLTITCTGCLGPAGIRRVRPHYNEAIKLTQEQELLLNLVRLRYDESPLFLSLDAVTAQMTGGSNAGVNAEADGGRARYFGTGSLSFEDRPTLSYTPRDSAEFARSMLSPINVENLGLLTRLGWDNQRVMRMVVKQINGVENAILAGGPVPEYPPEYADFQQVAFLSAEMRDLDYSEINVEERPFVVTRATGLTQPSGNQAVRAAESSFSIDARDDEIEVSRPERQLIANLNPQTQFEPEVQLFRQLLNLRQDITEYPIVPASEGHFEALNNVEGMHEIRVSTRAPIEIMFYLSKGVDIPCEHAQCGLAVMTKNHDGTNFNWHDVVGDLIDIRCCRKKPNARLRVKYCGYWFYIDNCDHVSKRTLLMLINIMEFSNVESKSRQPALTLPL